ncbi:hypothetical protein GEV33_004277 [Tenebrio molitor]|uniref:Uncharacterized protein n=1 Tax=Tenebrio molitor TaxID=7067 RepID=A0A8J6LDI5_TENMO|nr:hypothetical protein GEV33_004277 [Tenebrio molitor]
MRSLGHHRHRENRKHLQKDRFIAIERINPGTLGKAYRYAVERIKWWVTNTDIASLSVARSGDTCFLHQDPPSSPIKATSPTGPFTYLGYRPCDLDREPSDPINYCSN